MKLYYVGKKPPKTPGQLRSDVFHKKDAKNMARHFNLFEPGKYKIYSVRFVEEKKDGKQDEALDL